MRWFIALSFILFVVPSCACSPNPRRDVGRPTEAGTDAERGSQCFDRIDNDGDGVSDCVDPDCVADPSCMGFDSGPRRDTGFDECTAFETTADALYAPVDIVWVIDNSGSMSEEADQIQRRLNDFVVAIEASGIDDYHVVLLTRSGFVAVPEPLASDTARYRFIDTNVQSHDSFERILERVPMFRDFLRPEAPLHVVFVTDDESEMGATAFQTSFEAAVGRPFVGHAIVSPPGSTHMEFVLTLPGCTGPTGDAADNGQQYWSLATLTGGLHLSICSADWGFLFDQLLDLVAVPMRLPCRFALPDPPMGMTFDPNYVNVVYTPGGGGAPITIPRSATGTCDGFTWVYDRISMPTEIILCPDACTAVEGDGAGVVRVQLGCIGILD